MQTGETSVPAPNQPATRQQGCWKGFSVTKKILFFTVLAHLLCAIGASVWIVQTYHREKPKQVFHSISPGPPGASNRALEHKVQMKRKAMSAPMPAKRVTTTGLAKVVMPPMPTMDTQLPPISPAAMAMGMGGVGLRTLPDGNNASAASAAFSHPGGTMFTAAIGGLKIEARQLAVVLDVSGSVAQYQDELQKYVAQTFPGSEVGTFSWAGFSNSPGRAGSIGTVMLGFLNSPKKFDAIYVFSDFGETRGEQDASAQIQTLIREKKVRLYLHVLRAPGKEARINDVLQGIVAFARSTGGNVKVGAMPRM